MSESLLPVEDGQLWEEESSDDLPLVEEPIPAFIEEVEATPVRDTRTNPRLPIRTSSGSSKERDPIADPVKSYLKAIGKIPLLKAAEEVELMKQIEAGIFAERLLATNEQYNAEVSELEIIMRQGNRAFETMQESNLRLVVSVARRYTGRGMEFLDLIQEGNLGLRRAVEMFDYTKGFKFSTYASWWIRQAITRSLADQSRTIRIPVHVHEQIGALERARRGLINDGEEPTVDAIVERLEGKFSAEKVKELLRVNQATLSLNSKISEDESAEFGDLIEDETAERPDDKAAYAVLPDMLSKVLNDQVANPKHRSIIRMRFGLDGNQPMTLEAVGREVNLTRERVRQIVTKYIGDEKVRGKVFEDERMAGLKEYLD